MSVVECNRKIYIYIYVYLLSGQPSSTSSWFEWEPEIFKIAKLYFRTSHTLTSAYIFPILFFVDTFSKRLSRRICLTIKSFFDL